MNTIILHGLGQTPEDWKTVREQLEKRNSKDTVFCPDMTEWIGKSQLCYDRLYAGLETYCGQIGGTFHLCGLSLGGILALQYSAAHPERVKSLIVIGTQYKMPKALLRLQNGIFRLLPDSGFQNMGFGKKQVIQLSKSMMDLDLTGNLKQITCPTLILCGEKDWLNWQASRRLEKAIPHANAERILHAGHEVNKENADDAGEKIRKFLETV